MTNFTINEKGIIECYDIGGTNTRAAFIVNDQLKEPFVNERKDKRSVVSLVQQSQRISSSAQQDRATDS